MIRALLDGTKTQTRRLCKAHDVTGGQAWKVGGDPMPCPYGVAGDRLWVREAWKVDTDEPGCTWLVYRADGARRDRDVRMGHDAAVAYGDPVNGIHWRPSIHMPRWASRLTLDVVSVRVERLQDITAADIIAEGAVARPHDDPALGRMPVSSFDGKAYLDLASLWAAGWESVNGKRAPWASNPWVWAVEFAPLAQTQKRPTPPSLETPGAR